MPLFFNSSCISNIIFSIVPVAINKFLLPFFISFHLPISNGLSSSILNTESLGILITKGPELKSLDNSKASSNSFAVVGQRTVKFCIVKKNDKSYIPL